jgi:peptidoglycan/LPS O-acetylase OafA/YrhL
MRKNYLDRIENNIITFSNNSLELRYILTFAVFYSHFFAIYGLTEPSLFWGAHSLGWYAVNLFFFLSGILVTQSYYNNNFLSYTINRVFRIMPAYILALIVSVLSVIIFDNLAININLVFQSIKGIFLWLLPINNIEPAIQGSWTTSSIPSSLNGSLWTISFEVVCYFILLPIILLKNRIILRLMLSAILIYFLFRIGVILDNQTIRFDLLRVFNYFIIGIGFYKLIVTKKINFLLILSILLIITTERNFNEITINIFIILLTIYFTFYFTKKTFIKNDYSYGIYLYAWPISQIVKTYLPNNGGGEHLFYLKIMLAYLLLLIISFISWHLIEKNVLNMKKKYKNIRISYD